MIKIKIRDLTVVTVIIVLNLCFLNDCRAELESQRFKYYKVIGSQSVETGKNYRIVLDRDIYNESQYSLNDLRVVFNEKEEVPYEMVTFKEQKRSQTFETKIVENNVGQDKSNILIIDLGESGKKNNKVMLDIAEYNFGRRVMVEGSNDAKNWQMLVKDKYIYDFNFSGENPEKRGDIRWLRVVDNRYMADFSYAAVSRNTSIAYKENQFRYLKITVFSAKEENQITINKVEVSSFVQNTAQESEYVYSINSQAMNKERKSTEITLDLGAKNVPISRIKIVSGSKNYYRPVFLQGSNDLKEWQDVGSGEIFDYDIENFKDAKKEISFPEAKFRYYKLVIFDRDNPPIKIDALTGMSLDRNIMFPYQAKGELRIYYGNPNFSKPTYDYSNFALKLDTRILKVLSLGKQTVNPVYVPDKIKKPWTEERPYLLWTVIIAIVAILLFMVAAMLKKIK